MPEIASRDDADEFTIDLLIGEDGNFRKPRHPLILVIQHFEGAKPSAEGDLMLRLDVLIAENQDLLFHEDIEDLIEEVLGQLLLQVYARNGYPELIRQSFHLQRHRSALLCSPRCK